MINDGHYKNRPKKIYREEWIVIKNGNIKYIKCLIHIIKIKKKAKSYMHKENIRTYFTTWNTK